MLSSCGFWSRCVWPFQLCVLKTRKYCRLLAENEEQTCPDGRKGAGPPGSWRECPQTWSCSMGRPRQSFSLWVGEEGREGGGWRSESSASEAVGEPTASVVSFGILIRARHQGLLGSPLVVLWSILIRARHRGLLGSPLVVLRSILIRAQH